MTSDSDQRSGVIGTIKLIDKHVEKHWLTDVYKLIAWNSELTCIGWWFWGPPLVSAFSLFPHTFWSHQEGLLAIRRALSTTYTECICAHETNKTPSWHAYLISTQVLIDTAWCQRIQQLYMSIWYWASPFLGGLIIKMTCTSMCWVTWLVWAGLTIWLSCMPMATTIVMLCYTDENE